MSPDRLVTWREAQGLHGQTSEETTGNGTGRYTEVVKTTVAPPLKHIMLSIFSDGHFIFTSFCLFAFADNTPM